uniref:Paraspeckle component 1 n=1 Tax=Pan paniscus TaxID=9597 RepID=A0A2R8ZHY0_PANPA
MMLRGNLKQVHGVHYRHQEFPQAGREDVHAALPPLRGKSAHRHHGGGLQEALRTLWRAQRSLHQPGPWLRLHPLGSIQETCFLNNY